MNLGLNLGLGTSRAVGGAPVVTGFIGASTANAASATSITVAVPAGAQAGDILVAFGASSSTNEHSTPSGWVDRFVGLGLCIRSLASYDGTTPDYNFPISTATSQPQAIVLLCYRGYDWGAGTGVSGNAVDPTPPNLTVPAANSIVVQIAAALAAAHTYSMPAGWISRAAVSTNRSIGAFHREALAPSGVLTSTTMTRTAGAGNSRGLAFSLSPKP